MEEIDWKAEYTKAVNNIDRLNSERERLELQVEKLNKVIEKYVADDARYLANLRAKDLQIADLKATSCSLRHADDLAEERDQLKLQIEGMQKVVEAARAVYKVRNEAVKWAQQGVTPAFDRYKKRHQEACEQLDRAVEGLTEKRFCVICKAKPALYSDRCAECYAALVSGEERGR